MSVANSGLSGSISGLSGLSATVAANTTSITNQNLLLLLILLLMLMLILERHIMLLQENLKAVRQMVFIFLISLSNYKHHLSVQMFFMELKIQQQVRIMFLVKKLNVAQDAKYSFLILVWLKLLLFRPMQELLLNQPLQEQ